MLVAIFVPGWQSCSFLMFMVITNDIYSFKNILLPVCYGVWVFSFTFELFSDLGLYPGL